MSPYTSEEDQHIPPKDVVTIVYECVYSIGGKDEQENHFIAEFWVRFLL